MPPSNSQPRSAPPPATELSQVLADLGLDASDVLPVGSADVPAAALLSTVAPGELPTPERLRTLRQDASQTLATDGHLLVHLGGRRSNEEMARWRDGLWPEFHVGTRYIFAAAGVITRVVLQGATSLGGPATSPGSVREGELL